MDTFRLDEWLSEHVEVARRNRAGYDLTMDTTRHEETGGWIAYDINGNGHWGATREIAERVASEWN